MDRDNKIGAHKDPERVHLRRQSDPLPSRPDSLGGSSGRQSPESLLRHEFHLCPIIDALPVLIADVGADLRYRFVNRAYESWFDRPRSRIIGQPIREVLGEPLYQLAFPYIEKVLSGEEVRYESAIRVQDRETREVLMRYLPDRRNAGEINGFFVLGTDITEYKQTMERLNLAHFAIDRSRDAAFWIRQDGSFLDVNEAACRSLGYPREELLALKVSDIDPLFPAEAWPEQWQRVRSDQTAVFETEHRDRSGRIFPVEVSANYLEFGDQAYLCAFARDITERKADQNRLQKSEERFRVLVQHAPDVILTVDRQGHILFINHTLPEYTVEGVIGTHIRTYLSEDDSLRYLAVLEEVFASGTPGSVEVSAAGDTRWLCRLVPIRTGDAGGKVESAMVIATEITERKKAEEALLRSHERFQALSRKLLEVQEKERRQIARDLHDEIGQALTALKMNLQSAERLSDAAAVRPYLDESLELADRLLQHVRNLSIDLRPSVLDDLGLAAALQWYAARQADRSGITIRCKVDPHGLGLSFEQETACFRVAQEALTNVVRHAQADHVDLSLTTRGQTIELTIRDDGIGFDLPSALGRASRGNSMGLLSMQERVQLAGGEIRIDSRPKSGTEIRVCFRQDPL